ncbi:MAG TPA: hypothetical protein VFU09_13000 [Candidatus Udaeobacter sp.]|nr:hypothetical protein [Candidatus Udaeobacter sp.]
MRLVNVQSIRDYIEKQSAVPTYGKARSRDYYIDNGRKGAKAKAEKSHSEIGGQKKEALPSGSASKHRNQQTQNSEKMDLPR